LIDLPEGAVIGGWYQRYEGTGSICLSANILPNEFEAAVSKRSAELKAISHDGGGTLLEKEIRLSLPHSTAILYWENNYYKDTFLKADCYALIDKCMYKLKSHTRTDPVKQKEHIEFFDEVFRSIRLLKPDEIPREHGFCFDRSILVDHPRPELFGNVIASAIWIDHPDVHFRFTTFGNGPETDPPLLERLKKVNQYSGAQVLRSGRRDLLNGEMGEEHLERVTEDNGTEGHLFIWEAQGLPNAQYEHPQMRLDMSTGNGKHGPENASLSDEDALKLWDAILNSIRLRPVVKSNY
jgi:hypothetical protein